MHDAFDILTYLQFQQTSCRTIFTEEPDHLAKNYYTPKPRIAMDDDIYATNHGCKAGNFKNLGFSGVFKNLRKLKIPKLGFLGFSNTFLINIFQIFGP
jgi:hypothetical protein